MGGRGTSGAPGATSAARTAGATSACPPQKLGTKSNRADVKEPSFLTRGQASTVSLFGDRVLRATDSFIENGGCWQKPSTWTGPSLAWLRLVSPATGQQACFQPRRSRVGPDPTGRPWGRRRDDSRGGCWLVAGAREARRAGRSRPPQIPSARTSGREATASLRQDRRSSCLR